MTPYYDKGGIAIYLGDCLEVMPQLSPPFDAIISDWPYGQTACSWDSVIPLEPLWAECKRLIKRNGAIVLFASEPFNFALYNNNPEWFKYSWVWDKKRATGGQNADKRPMKAHEIIMVFAEGVNTYNPQMEEFTSDEIARMRKHDTYGAPPAIGGSWNVVKGWYKGRQKHPRSIIRVNGIGSTDKERVGHPTQKPLDLMAYLIRTYTNPGELILDNAMGSGTTLVAAKNEGRRAVGIEQEEEYCRIAVKRLQLPSSFQVEVPGKAKVEQLGLFGES